MKILSSPTSIVVAALTASVAILGFVPESSANVIVNGDFEAPTVNNPANGNAFITYTSGSGIAGWTIGAQTDPAWTNILGVDHIGTAWTGVSNTAGDQSVDIDSDATLFQTFSTEIGKSYTLSFYYSHNSDSPTGTSSGLATIKGSSDTYLLDTGLLTHNTSNSFADMKWTHYTNTFVADATTATLTFQGHLANVGYGFAVDGVSVTPSSVTPSSVPEPTSLGLGAIGLLSVVFRRRFRVRRTI